jgi:predicted nuclease of restriction endonuclease-like RecB superfamily
LLVPRYLTERDDVWVREVLEDLDGLVGREAREVAAAFTGRVLETARSGGASPKAIAGVWHVCSRIWELRTRAPLRPRVVRRTAFEEGARCATREEALDAAAERLGACKEQLLSSLFADRASARRLHAPTDLPSPREVVLRYNLSLLQGLLLRATGLDVLARSHVRSVVRFAKLRRLLCTYDAVQDGLRISLSGPLSIFHNTTKYGYALANFVPAAIATPGWSIEARCLVAGESATLRTNSAGPIASTHTLPKDFDSAVERRLARDVRRLGTDWDLVRETEVVHAGGRIFFPDFTLVRGNDRILVEIVGYHTPEYLTSKLRVLREAGLTRRIVCVDESLACDSGDVCAGAVLRYRKNVDAGALIDAAERMATAHGASAG